MLLIGIRPFHREEGRLEDVKIHIVQRGETIWDIARKYGVDVTAVQEMNPQISSPEMIMPGMKIKIPTIAKQVRKETQVKEKVEKKESKQQPSPKVQEQMLKKEQQIPKQPKEFLTKEGPIIQMPQMPVLPNDMLETEQDSQPKQKKKGKVDATEKMDQAPIFPSMPSGEWEHSYAYPMPIAPVPMIPCPCQWMYYSPCAYPNMHMPWGGLQEPFLHSPYQAPSYEQPIAMQGYDGGTDSSFMKSRENEEEEKEVDQESVVNPKREDPPQALETYPHFYQQPVYPTPPTFPDFYNEETSKEKDSE